MIVENKDLPAMQNKNETSAATFNGHTEQHVEQKDVVIIGNGPSGIALSFMLSGNLPYYNGRTHPDELLTARLGFVSRHKSLAEQDLRHLADGLEGRSTNPVSLLVDALEHPCADLGLELPSLVDWKADKDENQIDHVVLGKGLPGGSWHSMDPHILTLSLGSWMALPGLPYFNGRDSRTSAGNVAQYYVEYVRQLQLEKYFRSSTIVTDIKNIQKCCRKKSKVISSKISKNIDGETAPKCNGVPNVTFTTNDIPYDGKRDRNYKTSQTALSDEHCDDISGSLKNGGAVVNTMPMVANKEDVGVPNDLNYNHAPYVINGASKVGGEPPIGFIGNGIAKDLNSNTGVESFFDCENDLGCCFCNELKKQNNKKSRLISCECCISQNMQYHAGRIEEDLGIYDFGGSKNFTLAFSCPEMKKSGGQEVCSILDRSQSFTCDRKNYLNCSRFCSIDKNNDNTYSNIEQLKKSSNSENNLLVSDKHKLEQKKNMIQEPRSVTSECLLLSSDDSDDNDEACVDNRCKCDRTSKWKVEGYDEISGEPFTYITKNVVLATGSSDRPNRLGVYGEDENPDWILHHLRDLEDALDNLTESERELADPVLVVGAGLSAADAIIAARFRSLPVLHVFRRRNVGLDKQLPENMYPEYHKVHQMMSDSHSTYPLYTSLPEYNLVEICPKTRKVTLQNSKTGSFQTHTVSFITILIGARPDLHFLPADLSLGVNKILPIDCKTNPIDINPFTHEILEHPGLYALGPLAGDNFVRFIPGGALAITSNLLNEQRLETADVAGDTFEDCIEADFQMLEN